MQNTKEYLRVSSLPLASDQQEAFLTVPEKIVGVFDSGIGGLSVMRALRALLPFQPMIYLGDQAHVPYGVRQVEEVRQFSHVITRFLMDQGARLIVVACNTASVAALRSLREMYPQTPFVGMEPAVKPAAEQTRSGTVGVLATTATFHTAMYASVVERFAHGVTILEDDCPGLVSQIEKGDLDGAETKQILERALHPMMEKGVDTIVMGCTHYPFVIPLIQQIVGPDVRVIDPAPAIARQVKRMLEAHQLVAEEIAPGALRFITTGDPVQFACMIQTLLGEKHNTEQARWQDDKLFL